MDFAKNTGGGGKWFSGKATLEERNGVWKVSFAPREQGGETKSYKFPDSMLPEFPEKITNLGKYYVGIVLEADGEGEATSKVEEVLTIRPLMWVDELMKVVDVTREGNSSGKNPTGEPQFYAKTVSYKGKEEQEVRQVNWMLEFVDGEFKGVRVPYNVHYRFVGADDGHATYDFTEYVYNLPQATRVKQVVNFYDRQLNVIDPPIEWPEDGNIIPTLFARILDKDQHFLASGNNGWIQDLETTDKPAPPVQEEAPVPDESKEDPAQIKEQDDGLEDW